MPYPNSILYNCPILLLPPKAPAHINAAGSHLGSPGVLSLPARTAWLMRRVHWEITSGTLALQAFLRFYICFPPALNSPPTHTHTHPPQTNRKKPIEVITSIGLTLYYIVPTQGTFYESLSLCFHLAKMSGTGRSAPRPLSGACRIL